MPASGEALQHGEGVGGIVRLAQNVAIHSHHRVGGKDDGFFLREWGSFRTCSAVSYTHLDVYKRQGVYTYLAYAGQCGQRPCQSFGLGKAEGARGAHAHSA